ncbi:Sulfotransferase domain-containing protein [Fodinibius salinus]|uniref:Sulfotransferase domain-containing protein n=1 Tax=Fodinibius salinus TaxID=860790 RepID=A0A5D3YEE7_9BACT|nr:sulfotransferase [Fodinibius salinus]TYP91721.1 Sulfotransferase domain-containing protein [Fodinibius salinus]
MNNIAIFGVPRSGTSWLGQIFNSSPNVAYRYQPIFSYSFDEEISADSSSEDINTFHNALLATDDEFVCQSTNLSGNPTPSFKKENITHLVWKEVRYLNIIPTLLQQSDTKIIGIVRHPCGVINSWQNAPKEFDKQWNIKDEWRYANKKNSDIEDFYGYERWVKATKLMLDMAQQFPNQCCIQSYEKLVGNPIQQSRKVLEFAGLSLNEQTKSFLQNSTTSPSDDPYDVYRKNKTGFEWKSQLNPVIINEIANDDRFIEIEKHFEWNTLEQKNR